MACCPYGKSPKLLLAQIFTGFLVLFGFLFSSWLSWIFGLVAFVLIMLPACTKVNSKIIQAAIIFGGLAGVLEFIFFFLVLHYYGTALIVVIVLAFLWAAYIILIQRAKIEILESDDNAVSRSAEGNVAAVAPVPDAVLPAAEGHLVGGAMTKNDIEMQDISLT